MIPYQKCNNSGGDCSWVGVDPMYMSVGRCEGDENMFFLSQIVGIFQ